MSRITAPAGLITEAGGGADSLAWCGCWEVESDTGGPTYVHTTGRHNEGSNSILADGYTRWLKQSEILCTRGYWHPRFSQ